MLSKLRTTLPKGPLTFQNTAKKASVACILRGSENLEMLFIKRASNDGDKWSGQIAFPGGRKDAEDDNVRDTAEREVLEEIGLDLSVGFEYIGRAKDFKAQTDFAVAVCLYRQTCDLTPKMTLQDTEVALTGWIPTTCFLDPSNKTHVSFPELSPSMEFSAINIPLNDITLAGNQSDIPPPPYVLWGLTLRMTTDILSHMIDDYSAAPQFRFTGRFGTAKQAVFIGVMSTFDTLGYHPTYKLILTLQYLLMFGGVAAASASGAILFNSYRAKL